MCGLQLWHICLSFILNLLILHIGTPPHPLLVVLSQDVVDCCEALLLGVKHLAFEGWCECCQVRVPFMPLHALNVWARNCWLMRGCPLSLPGLFLLFLLLPSLQSSLSPWALSLPKLLSVPVGSWAPEKGRCLAQLPHAHGRQVAASSALQVVGPEGGSTSGNHS